MKKIFAITVLMILALNAKADDIFATGYYLQNDQKVAAVYKNGEIIYTVSHEGMNATPKTIVCDENKNIYWMINIYQGTSFKYTEIWKNDLLYVSTQGMSGVRIIDIYCLDDTLYYAGYQNNEDTISVATVWQGNGFTPHWTLGDGIHDSYLYDADVDKSTGTPYFCGKIQEDRTKAVVWKEQELYYKYDIENLSPYITVTYSSVSEISIDQGNVYTLGDYEVSITDDDEVSYDAIWKNNEVIQESSLENGMLSKLCAFDGDYYYCNIWPHGMEYTIVKNGSYTALLQFPFNGSAGANKIKAVASDIYVLGIFENKGCIWKNFEVLMQPENCAELFDMIVVETSNPPDHSEWYYEILNDGSITYQHLECAADTTIGNERPKIIVRSNTIYDRKEATEVTHEYVYERDGKVYWWNKDLEEFTVLYDYNAEVGDEWEIKVDTESLTMHVDSIWYHEFDGRSYHIIHVSDANDLFTGDIVCGIGHLTSFFPERLMNRGKSYRVTGLRCYWVEGNLIFKTNRDDCDAIYAELHNGIDEDGPSTGSGTLTVYPNPANGILTVSVRLPQCDSPTTGQTEYQISNLMGQTLLQGRISAENQQLDISNLPAGMYFISVGEQTVKFVVK